MSTTPFLVFIPPFSKMATKENLMLNYFMPSWEFPFHCPVPGFCPSGKKVSLTATKGQRYPRIQAPYNPTSLASKQCGIAVQSTHSKYPPETALKSLHFNVQHKGSADISPLTSVSPRWSSQEGHLSFELRNNHHLLSLALPRWGKSSFSSYLPC